MRTALLLAFCLLFAMSCSAQKRGYTALGEQDSVLVGYRLNVRKEKPTEIWLRIENASKVRRHVYAQLVLQHEGVIVETFEADSLLAPGHTLTGKLNGFYFISQTLTSEQLQDPATSIELGSLRAPEETDE